MTSSTTTVLNEALSAYVQGAIDTTREVLDAALQSAAIRDNLEDALAVCCFRGAIAAMEGDHNIAEILAPSAGAKLHGMLTGYLEGLSEMACNNFEMARLKFEDLKKEFANDDVTGGGHVSGCYLANLGLAAVYFQRKQFKESFTEYRQVLEALGTTATPKVVRVGMGMCAFCLNEPLEAAKILEREMHLHPDNDLALLALLVVYVHLRRMHEVTETVAKLRERVPENTSILVRAADLLYFRSVEEGSIRSTSKTIANILDQVRSTGSVEDIALADYQEGRMNIVLGRFERAQTLLESALHIIPSLLPARIHYAHLLILRHKEVDGLKQLLDLCDEYPNQREVLQLLACHVSERGLHEKALLHCRRLVDSVAPGDVCSWALAAWCSRLDEEQCLERHNHLLKIQKELNLPRSREIMANAAVLAKDVDALQALVDEALGASYLQTLDGSSASPDLSVHNVPLLYNLALLKEKEDRKMSRQLYTYLVKTHCTFPEPYFRLYTMAKEDQYHRQAVMWLTLLVRVMTEAEKTVKTMPSTTSTHKNKAVTACSNCLQLAKSFIGVSFFEHRQYSVAMMILRSTQKKTSLLDPASALCLAVYYLRCAQRRSKDNHRFLQKAKAEFKRVLEADPVNLLAAHGLGCCLGLEDQYDSCQSLLLRVGESLPNRNYVLDGNRAHISNVKTRVENYKQAIDYLLKEKERSASEDSCLGLCYAGEMRFVEARQVLKSALEKWPNRPMLLYNAALIHCAAFLHGVARSGATTLDVGLQLRDILQEAVLLMAKFFSLDPESRDMVLGTLYLKRLGNYCLTVMHRKLEPLIAIGTENTKQRERDAEQWAQALASYRRSVKEREEEALQQQKREEEVKALAQRELLDQFTRSGFTLSDTGMYQDREDQLINREVQDDSMPEEQDGILLNATADEILAGMPFAVENNNAVLPSDENAAAAA